MSLVIYFADANTTLKLITDYIDNSTAYIRNIEHFIRLKYCILTSSKCSGTYQKQNEHELNELKYEIQNFLELNLKFEQAIAKMQDEIAKVEQENENFKF